MHVVFVDQAFDDLRAGSGRTEPFFAHRFAQLLVLDELSGAFHRREERRLGEACRRLRLSSANFHLPGVHFLSVPDRDQARGLGGFGFLSVDLEPAGFGHYPALGLEGFALDARDARRDKVLGCGGEHCKKTPYDQIVELRFRLREVPLLLNRGDDREVVGNLLVVEYALVGLDPALLQDLRRMPRVAGGFLSGECIERSLHRAQIVLGQRARVGSRIREDLVPFVQRLGKRERGLRRKAETAVRVALQARQVVEKGRELRGGLRFLGGDARPSQAARADGRGALLLPHPLGPRLSVFFRFLEVFVEPPAGVLALRGGKRGVNFPIVARLETAYPVLALDEDRKRRGLNAADRGLVEAAFLRIESGHRSRAVDAYQPIRFRTAHRGVGERAEIAVLRQLLETLTDRALRHRLQPQALDRLLVAGMLDDVTENQFALTTGVACVDDARYVLAPEQLHQESQSFRGALDGLQIEMRRNDRKVGKRPFAALDLHAFRRDEFQQMADRRREHIIPALVIIAVAREATQSPRDVVRDGGLFGDDEFFGHRKRSQRRAIRIELARTRSAE